MKSATLATGLLASTALAQPHGHGHGHAHQHIKRDVATVWVTDVVTETVIEYIDVTATTWFTPATPAVSSPSTSSSETPGQFFEGSSSQAPVETPAAAPAPAVETTTQAPPPPPPTTTSTTTTTPAPAPAPATSAASSGDSGSGGTPSDAFNGDLTWYTIGLGACGEDDTGKDMTDPIVALSYLLMGTESNDNPYCGKTITISYGGKTATATVKDKCMGCAIHAIDVSQLVFTEVIGDLGVGRAPVTWWFND